jgi:hypothetical protein
LLEQALAFHSDHGGSDCPVCGTQTALTATWAESTRKEIARLRAIAAGSDHAHRAATEAMQKARALLTPPPRLLDQLFQIGVEGLDVARREWEAWHAGASLNDLLVMAAHLENRHEAFADAIDLLKKSAAAELRRREDRWRPIAAQI